MTGAFTWSSPLRRIFKRLPNLSLREQPVLYLLNVLATEVTDLRTGQIGHGLGPRVTPSYDDSFS